MRGHGVKRNKAKTKNNNNKKKKNKAVGNLWGAGEGLSGDSPNQKGKKDKGTPPDSRLGKGWRLGRKGNFTADITS